MSFSFGFSGDDVDEDESRNKESIMNDGRLVEAMDLTSIDDSSVLISPTSHTLSDLVSSDGMHDTAMSQAVGDEAATRKWQISRRSVFDIRTQLMAEADVEADGYSSNDTLLSGLEHGDLTKGVYEGGFKTWECAVDLAGFLAARSDLYLGDDSDLHVIELGAGSAIPSLILLREALLLHELGRRKGDGKVHFTLCDYNHDVLRLATAPNVFLVERLLAAATTLNSIEQNSEERQDDRSDEQEIEDIDETTIKAAASHLDAAGISMNFVSGAWGLDLVNLCQPPSSLRSDRQLRTLVLASETIYSPASIATFTDTLGSLFRRREMAQAFVAAKKVYFGVGGGVQDFALEVEKSGGHLRKVLDVAGAGVGRVVLEISF